MSLKCHHSWCTIILVTKLNQLFACMHISSVLTWQTLENMILIQLTFHICQPLMALYSNTVSQKNMKWARPVTTAFRSAGHQHDMCHDHFTYFQCKAHTRGTRQYCRTWLTSWKCHTLVRFRHQNYLVRFRERCRWFGLGKDSHRTQTPVSGVKVLCLAIQPPQLLQLWSLSLFKLLTDDKKCGAGTKHFSSSDALLWKLCWVSRKTLTIRVHVHESIDYISLLFHEMPWYWAGMCHRDPLYKPNNRQVFYLYFLREVCATLLHRNGSENVFFFKLNYSSTAVWFWGFGVLIVLSAFILPVPAGSCLVIAYCNL